MKNMKNLIKICGITLILGGICFVITNAIFSPYVDFTTAYSATLTSPAFFNRMIFAALTVVLILFGSIGIYLHYSEIERARIFRMIAFLLTFFSCSNWRLLKGKRPVTNPNIPLFLSRIGKNITKRSKC